MNLIQYILKIYSEKADLKLNIKKKIISGIQSHHFIPNRWGNSGSSDRFYFGGAPKSLRMVTAATKLRQMFLEEKL